MQWSASISQNQTESSNLGAEVFLSPDTDLIVRKMILEILIIGHYQPNQEWTWASIKMY